MHAYVEIPENVQAHTTFSVENLWRMTGYWQVISSFDVSRMAKLRPLILASTGMVCVVVVVRTVMCCEINYLSCR